MRSHGTRTLIGKIYNFGVIVDCNQLLRGILWRREWNGQGVLVEPGCACRWALRGHSGDGFLVAIEDVCAVGQLKIKVNPIGRPREV